MCCFLHLTSLYRTNVFRSQIIFFIKFFITSLCLGKVMKFFSLHSVMQRLRKRRVRLREIKADVTFFRSVFLRSNYRMSLINYPAYFSNFPTNVCRLLCRCRLFSRKRRHRRCGLFEVAASPPLILRFFFRIRAFRGEYEIVF